MNTRQIVFATNNLHKLREIRQILGDKINILSLKDIGCNEDIPETSPTIQGNAMQKALYVAENYGVDCFADDTGLLVEALDDAPGVYTARFAALHDPSATSHDPLANMKVLLRLLAGKPNRRARFLTAIALVRKGLEPVVIEGICKGTIATEAAGDEGFGYDPVFLPDDGRGLTFAQMKAEDKNAISHRGKATRRLIEILSNS